jgi:prophage regulatory protein
MHNVFIRKPAVVKRTGLSLSTIYRLEIAGKFPRRRQITEGGSVAWVEAEVDEWVAERVRRVGKMPEARVRRDTAGRAA